MKKKMMFLCVAMLLYTGLLHAQAAANVPLKITLDKTVTLKFSSAVVMADRGRNELLVQRAKGTEDILLLKAAHAAMPQTNLTVVTADGSLYSFVVDYAADPVDLQYFFDRPSGTDRQMEMIAQLPAWLGRERDVHYQMKLALSGIYVKEDVMFLQLSVDNRSAIDYSIASLDFSIVDKRQVKRTARQELTLFPLNEYGKADILKGGNSQCWVIAVPKFTIPDRKYLLIRLMEQNGGRHLKLKIPGRTIMRARALR